MSPTNPDTAKPNRTFWKIAWAGASFQAASSAVDSATVVASLVYFLTGNVYGVGAASAVLRLGWLSSQLVVGFLAQRAQRRMPYYCIGAFGRAICIGMIALLLLLAKENEPTESLVAVGFLVLWTLYAFISGIVAVPYNDIVGRSIPSGQRSRMLAWRFFGGGMMALGVAAIADRLLNAGPVLTAYGWIFALACALMLVSSFSFVSAGEPPLVTSIAASPRQQSFGQFLAGGVAVWKRDPKFRLFLYSQWLAGATLMALPFNVIAATQAGLGIKHIGLLLGAQTVGALVSNPVWGSIGDRHSKLTLLQRVGWLRVATPVMAVGILAIGDAAGTTTPAAFMGLFFLVGALSNGMTIGFLGFLMEISPDEQRPAYSAYFNAFAAPAALLPLLGAAIADIVSLTWVFAIAVGASIAQLLVYRRLTPLSTSKP